MDFSNASEEKFQKVIEAAPDAIIMVDQHGNVSYANAQFKSIFGYEKDEILGQNIQLLIPESYRARHLQHITNYFKSPHTRPMGNNLEIHALHKDGKPFPVEISLSPLKINNEIIALAAIRDISERKEIEKMKNEFISMASHELRTPLTSIHGSIVLLLKQITGQQTRESLELLEIALKNTERLIRLTNDILDIEKIEAGKMNFSCQIYSANELVKEAVSLNKGFADKFYVKLTMKLLKDDEIKIKVDRDRLIQVITNLISNAIKYSPNDETVTVNLSTDHNDLVISVIDNGSGIPESFQKNVFQKFSQADSSAARKQEGTGLGLSISKLLVDGMNGQIYFKTKENAGTTFYLKFPAYKG